MRDSDEPGRASRHGGRDWGSYLGIQVSTDRVSAADLRAHARARLVVSRNDRLCVFSYVEVECKFSMLLLLYTCNPLHPWAPEGQRLRGKIVFRAACSIVTAVWTGGYSAYHEPLNSV